MKKDKGRSNADGAKGVSRRDFMKFGLAGLAMAAGGPALANLRYLESIENPMTHYPDRDWEKLYRDVFGYDRYFHFLCAPNDTHNCLLRAYVKNGVITRLGPSFGYGKAEDLYGNKASHRWDPRLCQKGLALVNRFYGPRRVKHPMVRKGFSDWAEAGFPRGADGRPPAEYFQRGRDEWLRMEWDEAADLAARAMVNIAETYSGEAGSDLLTQQAYDPDMIEALNGAGTQTIKVRGGMPLLGAMRIMALYRFANSLALLDTQIRGVDREEALGARYWDSYSWHTDLPPGHPMVTGQQTIDWDLCETENANLIIPWGMNWISTKMPDSHWLTEARLRGAKVVTVTVEYSSVANKSDEVIIIRAGSDGAFALGLARVIMEEELYDREFVERFTDLPLLVRSDNLQLLNPADVIEGYTLAELRNATKIIGDDEARPQITGQDVSLITESMRKEWGDFMVWDAEAGAPSPVSRDQVGTHFHENGVRPALRGSFEVTLANGETVEVKPIFQQLWDHLKDNYTPELTSHLTGANRDAVVNLARQIAANRGKTLIAVGMGPNHFFNNDCKDRSILLVGALTGNIGRHGGNVGSFAGNYRSAYFNGISHFIAEDIFDLELDPAAQSRVKPYLRAESAHFYNYGDRLLRVGNKNFTGRTHWPTPSKAMWFSNSNSLLGNAKWHHDVVVNTLPKIECVIASDWWWTASCEYADIVFGVDSWAEMRQPDMTASVTNPFLQMYPTSDIERIHDTRGDAEAPMLVGRALARITGDRRYADCWRFIDEGDGKPYLQRIIDASTTTRGYNVDDLLDKAKDGIPSLLLSRTYPKTMGWEQTNESKPWYTKTGRLEFYRPEPEFVEYGENLPVYREPVDGTHYEPNVIVGTPHPLIRFSGPRQYGLEDDDLSCETRQIRNVLMSPQQVVASSHPLAAQGYNHVYITPKYRHGVHTTPVDLDIIASWFGPFGDMHRRDKRMPWVGEAYVDINPRDARELDLDDGDYVWVDSDPSDRPYRNWSADDDDYKVSRCMLRVRYYPGIPTGLARTWFHMYVATPGSVKGHETRADGLARNPETGYQAMFRYGSHQSATRAWLRPTCLTDSLVRKDVHGQTLGKGFAPDVHCAVGAPKESVVKFEKAEPGGIDVQIWRPALLGLRPTYENPAMKLFIEGRFIET